MKYQRKSNFASAITDFVSQKHALGYSYEGGEDNLNRFDRFCFELFPTETILTRELGLCWAEKRQMEKASNQINRIAFVREFAKYINSIGGNAFVIPKGITKHVSRYIPHIYTKDELAAFFYAVDHFCYDKRVPGRNVLFPVFFRLLYCCGLRPMEARTLLAKNVDMETGVIKIIESKGHKDRNVVLARDVLNLCRKYRKLISKVFPHSEYFFPTRRGYYSGRGTEYVFNLVCRKAELADFKGNSPTMYSFRHTFATHCLYRWMREGKDLNAYLPYLSSYMGHDNLSYTAYYIHLVPEFFHQMGQMDIVKFESLLPEIEK